MAKKSKNINKITFEDYIKQKAKKGSLKQARTDYINERYKKSLRAAMGLDIKTGQGELDFIEENNINIGKYSLKTRIKNNPWLKRGRPASSAIKWFFREVLKDPLHYQWRRKLFLSGNLYYFTYTNPKYKDELDFYDNYPLVLSLGPKATQLGVRNIGINLHMLPPRVRIIVLCQVFELHKRYYRYLVFFDKTKPVQINYKLITKSLEAYGIKFGIRMYIPERMRTVCMFGIRDWHKAIFIPSRKYSKIRAAELIKRWTKYVRTLGYSTTSRVDWTSKV